MTRLQLRILIILIGVSAGASGCASTGATPAPFPTPGGPRAVRSTASGTTRPPGGYDVAGTALRLRGSPYRNGGTDPSAGFDCSGFVQYVYAQHGLAVPRKVSDQFRGGHDVQTTHLQPGDLVFFTTVSPGASHVGIAIGGDEFIHAPSGAGAVRVERMSASYWATRFVGARRVL